MVPQQDFPEANRVKREVPIVVVMGDPPYDQFGSRRALGE
jgi:hypothetical protein